MIGIRFSRASAKAVASMTLQVPLDRLLVAEPVVALGLGVLLRVGAVDAVDIGGLEHGLRIPVSAARSTAVVSVVKNGLPVPPASSTIRPLLEMSAARACGCRFRRPAAWRAPTCVRASRAEPLDRGLQHQRSSSRSPACPWCRRSAATRPCSETSTPRKMLPPPTTTPSSTPSLARGDQIVGDAVDGRLVDAEAFGADKRFAGDLDDDAAVGGSAHGVGRSSHRVERPCPRQLLARRRPRPRRRNRSPASRCLRRARSARSP